MDINTFILPVLQIVFLNIVLSGDNVGVIALAIRNLPEKQAKIASLIGISGALLIRVLFIAILSLIMSVEWLHIKLIGGLLLVKMTMDLMKLEEENETGMGKKVQDSFLKATMTIIIADISMSFDNVLALASAAHGNVTLVLVGLIINIPIIFFGSQIVAKLMQKYVIAIFVGASLLMYTSVTMILEDRLIGPHVSHLLALWFPWAAALIVFIYGIYTVRKLNVSNIQEGA